MTLIKHKTFYNKKKTYLLFWQLSSIQLKVSLSWIIVINALKILSEVAEECNKEKGSCMNNKCRLFYRVSHITVSTFFVIFSGSRAHTEELAIG